MPTSTCINVYTYPMTGKRMRMAVVRLIGKNFTAEIKKVGLLPEVEHHHQKYEHIEDQLNC
jgi:hypothetical protein